MKLDNDIIKEYLNKNIVNIYKKIKDSAERNIAKEANFRTDIAIILNDIFEDLEINQKIIPEQEYSVANGRIDSLYENIILEYKAPKKISNKSLENNRKFIVQLKEQMTGLAKKNKIEKGTILGTIFDGFNIIYIKYKNDVWNISGPFEANLEAIELFLKRLLSLSIEKKALTIENLLKDFNSKSLVTKNFIKLLYKKISTNTKSNKSKLLFEQWKSLFREVCGYDFNGNNLNIQNLKKYYEINSRDDMKLDYLIFSIQTYFCLIIKFLSIEILTYLSDRNQRSTNLSNISKQEDFKEQIENIESGGIYKKLGINNFLEGDFFGWYLFLWDDEIYTELRNLIEIFENYDCSSVNLESESAKDLLKDMYHNLLPKEIRHNLGEYYTPDWLAEFLINEMKIDYSKNQSFLDPNCGSGTFIVLLIKNYIIRNNLKLSKKDLLNKILTEIKGYDLNPLAVISARANYIISLGELLNERNDLIEIPIYLCDSMLTILEQKKFDRNCYIVSTKAGNFPIPISLVKDGVVNKILDILNEIVHFDYTDENFIERIKIENIVDKEILSEEEIVLKELYNIIHSLEKKGLNGIWTNVIKNAFAPIFQKKVDYIIGNPPWIVWQSLPEEYRKSIQKYWYTYKVFDHKGLTARLGSAHDDLSVLMTYVVMDNYLKDGGKLGFVINQNLFQSSGGGQGFRKLMIKENIPIGIEKVHDFVKVNPFEDLGASNKTAIFTAIKNKETIFPIDYVVWNKKNKGKIYSNIPLENVLNDFIKKIDLKARPLKEKNSSWILGTKEELDIFDKIINKSHKSNYKARKGVDTSANGIFWIEEKEKLVNNLVLVDNCSKIGKKNIKSVIDIPLEKELIYPLIRGKDIKKWRIETPYSIIIPYKTNGKVISKDELKINYFKTYSYFYNKKNCFEDTLINRATYKKHYLSLNSKNTVPEYVLYNIGDYTFSPYKVVWKTLATSMTAAVISNKDGKLIIPDHNIVMVPLYKEDEAYFLAGILNSDIVNKFVNAYISWFYSTHILENLLIPKFDTNNELHKKIVILSKKAHELSLLKNEELDDLEKHINETVKILLSN